MQLSEKDIQAIATNARIRLNDKEVTAMVGYLNDVIETLKPITEYDLKGVEPTYHPIAGQTNVMRDDVISPGLTQEEALANAPSQHNGHYRIPPILGNGGGDR